MPDINVNINGDDAERAAQHADEAALRAEAAAAAANFASKAFQREADARAAQAAGNLAQLDKLRQYQQAIKQVGPQTFKNFWNGPKTGTVPSPAPSYVQRLMQIGNWAGANRAGRPTAPAAQGAQNTTVGTGSPLNNNQWPAAPLAGWKQPGWGTNKANMSGGTGIGGNFGKTGFVGGQSSAKVRSLWNLTTNLSKGTMPVIFRTSLALWMTQKVSQIGREVFEMGMKGVHKSDPAELVALKFSSNVSDAVNAKIREMGKSVADGARGVIEFAGTGLAGLAGYGLAGLVTGIFGASANQRMGRVLQLTKEVSDKMAFFYTGKTPFVQRLNDLGSQWAAAADAADEARKKAFQYAEEFADRNADELAGLGFGTGAQIRSLVKSADATRKLVENAGRAAIGESPLYQPSNGDD